MEVSESYARPRELLLKAGFIFERPDPRVAWQAFKAFAVEPVSCAHDGLLFECGVYEWTGERRFHFGFVRQFTIDVDGDYDHTEQLHCKFRREPAAALIPVQKRLWAEELDGSAASFFTAVEALSEFREAMRFDGWDCELRQGEV